MNIKVRAVIVSLLMMSSGLLYFYVFHPSSDYEAYEETTMDLQVMVSVRNVGQALATDIPLRLAIPVEHAPLQYIESMGLSEEPERTTRDAFGNEFIHYTIESLAPFENKTFFINTSVRMISGDYNIRSSSMDEDLEDMSNYLQESLYINKNDPLIIELAREIAKNSTDISDTAWVTYEWIIDNIYYQQIPGEWDAATTLKNGEGGSAELANLFVALMRANNIPARRVSGWANPFYEGKELQLTRFAHGWAEFYLPGYGWIPVDPTWGKSNKFDSFAKSDHKHIILTLGSGVKFLRRGAYQEPYGNTEIKTDYQLTVIKMEAKNLSLKRDVITSIIFLLPVIFAGFVIQKKIKERRV